MIRLRTLLAAALLTIPMLALSAAVPTGGASRSPSYQAAASSAPPGCVWFLNHWICH
jgi:hypothetical protein